MVMNITIDDTAGVLSYSAGWRIQPNSDTSFFQSTYHAADSVNQTVSVTFNGTAVYIYGSKGTTYGAFTVQVDSLVTLHTSALPASSNPNVQYQQLLFADTFDSGTHLINLSTTTDRWVDIDYIILTTAGPDEANPNPGSFTSTVSALDPSSSNSQTSSSASTSSTPSPTSPLSSTATQTVSSHTNTVTAALTGVFGGLLGLVLLSLIVYRLLKRHQRRQYEREREFRRGARPYTSTPTIAGAGGLNGASERKGLFSGLLSNNNNGGGRNSNAGAGERSGTPYSGSTGNGSSPPMNVYNNTNYNNAGNGIRTGISPYGSVGAYGFTRSGPGGGSPYRQGVPVDPRQSIDFLSVRS